MAYVRTRAVVLRCTDYSDTSQVAALVTPDLGQVHVLAKGAKRPGKNLRMPLDVLTHFDIVLSRRTPGHLHLVTNWNVRETFPVLRKDMGCFWAAFHAAEVALSCTSENPDDGPVCDALLAFLRDLREGRGGGLPLLVYLVRVLKTIGSVPVAYECVQCGGKLHGGTRFGAAAGGALCGDCGAAGPGAFSISRGALAAMRHLISRERKHRALRLTPAQSAEIQRAFDEQIQYHLGKPLRTMRFLSQRAKGCVTAC